MPPTTTPARLQAAILRASIVLAVLIASLLGTGPVSAAEPDSSTPLPTVAGSGVLAAQGGGHVRLGGSYVLAGSLEGGTLRISGTSPASTVRVTGWVSKTRLADGTLVYRFGDATGHYWIAGRTIVTTIESHAMRFSAAGHGRAWLFGSGSYWVNGRGPNPWTEPGSAAKF